MSGASGKVPAAIHVTPEALADGPLARVRNGDIFRLDAHKGELQALVPQDEWRTRKAARRSSRDSEFGTGRELFAFMRGAAGAAESGASVFWGPD